MRSIEPDDWSRLAKENILEDDEFIDGILNGKNRNLPKKGIPPPRDMGNKVNKEERYDYQGKRGSNHESRLREYLTADTLPDNDILNSHRLSRNSILSEATENLTIDLKQDLMTVRQLNDELRAKLRETHDLQQELMSEKASLHQEFKELEKKLKNFSNGEVDILKKENADLKQQLEKKNQKLLILKEENLSLKSQIYGKNIFPATISSSQSPSLGVKSFRSVNLNSLNQGFSLPGVPDIDDFIQERRYPGEKIERLYSNGIKLTLYSNGDLKQDLPNGQSILQRQAKGQNGVFVDRREQNSFSPDEIYQIYQYPSGQIERLYCSGKMEITYPDKTVKTKYPSGKCEIKYFDGTTEIQNASGERKVYYPNGKMVPIPDYRIY